MAHFAKIFGIAWAIITGMYILVVLVVGGGFGVYWPAQSPPPRFLIDLFFYAWPVVPAAVIAGLWELARVAVIRRALKQRLP
jgi:hypothetical protein